MAGKRNYEWPLATEWDAAAFLTQDKSGGVTQRVSPALVETKLEADGFPKIPSPSANEVAVYGVGGWDSVKLADANIDAAAAIGWGKISKTGAVATDVGALPYASPTVASGKLTAAAATTGGASLNVPNGVTPTSPSDGDIWQDGSRLFMQGRILAVTKGASNSFGSGSSFAVMDAANPAKGVHIQLNAAGGMDVWTLQGGSWINELTLPIDGSIQLANLAGTGTRSVSADATGKLVANATEALPVANPTATGTLTAPAIRNTGGTASAIIKWDADGDEVASSLTDDGTTVSGTNLSASGAVAGGLSRMQSSAISPASQAWFGYVGLNSAGAYVGYYPGSDGAIRIAAATGQLVSIGTGAAYGQLVISDSGVKSASLEGLNSRIVRAGADGSLSAPSLGADKGSNFTLSESDAESFNITASSVTMTLPDPTNFRGRKFTIFAHSDVTLSMISGAGIRYQDLTGTGSWAENDNTVSISMEGTDFAGPHKMVEIWSSGLRWFARA